MESAKRTTLGPTFASTALVFAILFLAVFLLHLGLLRLPYFWDEAGYYVPAARDFFFSGKLIPYSTPSNAHPPLIMVYLAACWKVFGVSVVSTRVAMLAVAAFSLSGLFRLAELVANRSVATATVACTMLYPVFFVQSSLAQVDLAAAGLTFWGLAAYTQNRFRALALWMSLAVLAKETAILAPVALVLWELVSGWVKRSSKTVQLEYSRLIALLVPGIVLCAWYAYHHRATGYLLGNPEYFRYNVQATLSPLRFVIAFGLRIWQTFGYLHLWLLSAAMVFAMFRKPQLDGVTQRPRITIEVQLAFLAIAVSYMLFMSAIGGAVLARYMLPVVPLVILTAVSTLWRRVAQWTVVVAIIALAFIAALFVPPPYGFSLEDNLAYRDYIVMHQQAACFLESRYPNTPVLTAWPASDELSRPYLRYVNKPLRVVRMEDFTAEQVLSAADMRQSFGVVAAFSTKYEPSHPMFANWETWQKLKTRFFGFHRDLPPQVIAEMLGGTIEHMETRNGQWIAIIRIDRMENAALPSQGEGLMR
ncbi:MAG TPA: glycosyltransferase family 39 protein [Terriglobales bacterium]|jgi:4-amino-4-deoxy-L-arabinose transferase-like glycosyltransferase|nr:glycosyltransferase family 39 protein [Terriglobales bacterium]